ncbi:hypothetical protein [Polaromonas sp. CG_9.11]|uniref:hypothetical protein n=1 Tax=Polaromonas sp. CG_9.11 TaxID=2787730 RepID=UPI0018C914A9|nr:hypothetical protein [Polaromonas sp. CG_9.11]MBG6077290.1 hypothetical protein [Polaromonas sp. CG_9.11]
MGKPKAVNQLRSLLERAPSFIFGEVLKAKSTPYVADFGALAVSDPNPVRAGQKELGLAGQTMGRGPAKEVYELELEARLATLENRLNFCCTAWFTSAIKPPVQFLASA